LDKYRNNNIKILLLQVYTKKCVKESIKIIDKYVFYDTTTEFPTLFMPWATDLLPFEIEQNINNLEENVLDKNTNHVNFVGMITSECLRVKHHCLGKGYNRCSGRSPMILQIWYQDQDGLEDYCDGWASMQVNFCPFCGAQVDDENESEENE
jgi:hypothetical protein